jgi:hypothetical protein
MPVIGDIQAPGTVRGNKEYSKYIRLGDMMQSVLKCVKYLQILLYKYFLSDKIRYKL